MTTRSDGHDICMSWNNSDTVERASENNATDTESLLPMSGLQFSSGQCHDPWGNITHQPDEKTFVSRKKITETPGFSLGSCIKFRKNEFESCAGRIRQHYLVPATNSFSVQYCPNLQKGSK